MRRALHVSADDLKTFLDVLATSLPDAAATAGMP
jgi:hypothetical protein